MAVEVEVFIDLEERAARVLGRALRTSATKQVRGIASALRRADVGAAAQMVRRFDLGPAVRSVSDQLELIALNAVVLGAAQFVDGHAARRTKFVREKVIPVEVKNVVAQIVESVSSTQTEHVRSTIEQMVNEAEM